MPTSHYFGPLMENITRLMKDAALLRDNQRYASAYVLAVIAIEEIGKLAHLLWNDQGIPPQTKRKNWHLSKQSAAFSLILSSSIADEIIAMHDSVNPEKEVWISTLTERMNRSPAAKRLAAVERELIDKAKKAGLYQDDLRDGSQDKRDFTLSDVDEMMHQSLDAIKAMKNPRYLIVGRVVFDATHAKLL